MYRWVGLWGIWWLIVNFATLFDFSNDDDSGESLTDHIDDTVVDECTWVCVVEAGYEKLLLSVEKPPKLELRILLDHLKYASLGEDKQLPIIIAQNLEPDQEKQLLDLLRQ